MYSVVIFLSSFYLILFCPGALGWDRNYPVPEDVSCMHICTHWKGESEGKIGSPGLNFPVPESSGVLNSKRKRVQKVSRCTGARGRTLVHSIRYRIQDSAQSEGKQVHLVRSIRYRRIQRIRCRARGNRFTWFVLSGTGGFRLISYKDSRARGNRFTWFVLSGTGGFRYI
jgi:hypothetical protein